MADFAPILALGKSDDEAASQFLAGSKLIGGVSDPAGDFPVGTPVFTSDSDYSNPQYRGLVTAIGASDVTVQRAAAATSTNPSRIWNPTAYWLAAYPIAGPAENRRDLGISNVPTLDGNVYRTKYRDTAETIVFNWTHLPMSNLDDLRDFVDDSISGGVDQFTAAFYNHVTAATRLAIVKMLGNNLDVVAPVWGLAPLTVELLIRTEATYL